MTNLLWIELADTLITVVLVSCGWIILGRIGKLMLQELEDDIRNNTYTLNGEICASPFDFILGPCVILLCMVMYFMNMTVDIIKWIQHKRKPKKEKPYVPPQWDK